MKTRHLDPTEAPPGLRPSYPFREGLQTLGVSPTTGYQLLKDGALRTYLVGRKRFISGTEIARFIREREGCRP